MFVLFFFIYNILYYGMLVSIWFDGFEYPRRSAPSHEVHGGPPAARQTHLNQIPSQTFPFFYCLCLAWLLIPLSLYTSLHLCRYKTQLCEFVSSCDFIVFTTFKYTCITSLTLKIKYNIPYKSKTQSFLFDSCHVFYLRLFFQIFYQLKWAQRNFRS